MTDRELAWLPADAGKRIAAARDAAARVFGDRLRAVVLVGAALNPSRPDRGRAPELLVLVDVVEVADLTALAREAHAPMRAGVRLRTLTLEELRTGVDVFALEVAEWKDRHLLLQGEDVLAPLVVEPSHLRHSLELTLRGLGRRIRNRVLAGLGTDGQRDDAGRAVLEGLARLVVVAHHTLALLGKTPPDEEPALLHALAVEAGADASLLAAEVEHIGRTGYVRDPVRAVEALLRYVDRATLLVDGLQAGPPA